MAPKTPTFDVELSLVGLCLYAQRTKPPGVDVLLPYDRVHRAALAYDTSWLDGPSPDDVFPGPGNEEFGLLNLRYHRLSFSTTPATVGACGSCHGVNQLDQAGSLPPENPPLALYRLLEYWKTLPGAAAPEALN